MVSLSRLIPNMGEELSHRKSVVLNGAEHSIWHGAMKIKKNEKMHTRAQGKILFCINNDFHSHSENGGQPEGNICNGLKVQMCDRKDWEEIMKRID